MIQSLCFFIAHAWLLTIEAASVRKCRCGFVMTLEITLSPKPPCTLDLFSLLLLRHSLNICMNPVSAVHRLSLSLYPFCPLHFVLGWQPWNTASFPQLFSTEPQMKRYCQPFLSQAPFPINADKRLPYHLWPFTGNSEHTLFLLRMRPLNQQSPKWCGGI